MRLNVRWGVAVAAGVAAAALVAAPAWAHVEVSADKPQAGATNVTVTFSGEAESTTGGIKSEQVFLPTGITPAQVKLGKAPAGWTLTPGTDNVTIGGPALPKGTNAEWSIVISQLPTNATELVFKTLETYSDGEVQRWIDLQQPGQAEPEHPAPTLKLSPAAAAPTTTAPTTAAATSAGASTVAPGTGGGTSGWLIAAIVAVVLIVAAAAAVTIIRRRRTPPTT
jgi:hypothetical protein